MARAPKIVVCDDCGKKFEICYGTYCKKVKHNQIFRCSDCRRKHASETTKRQFQNMSPEEKAAIYEKQRMTVANKSPEEKQAEIDKRHMKMKARSPEEIKATSDKRRATIAAKSPEEKELMRKRISESHKRVWENKSPEQRKAEIDRLHADANTWWDNATDEMKSTANAKRSETIASRSGEEKLATHNKQSESAKRRRENMSEEERIADIKRLNRAAQEWWDNATEEDISNIADKKSAAMVSYWATLSDEERAERSRLDKNAQEAYWSTKGEEERKVHGEKVSDIWQRTLDEDKIARNDKIRETWLNKPEKERVSYAEYKREEWANKSDEEKAIHSRQTSHGLYNRPIAAKLETANRMAERDRDKTPGRFPQWFQNMFESYYGNRYQLQRENPLLGTIIHRWDYTVLDGNKPIMLIDIDDVGSHGDGPKEYGRAGRHGDAVGLEQSDAERGLTVPNEIPFIVISEACKDSFRDMISLLGKSYDEFMTWMYQRLKAQPFPYPKYTDRELLISYNRIRNRLEMNEKKGKTRLSMDHWDCLYGQHIMYHFYHSIWHDSMPGKLCPHDAYMNNDILMDMIRKRYILHVRNRNKITQCFLLSEEAPRVPIFTPIMGMKIIHKYCMGYDTIVDCNTQYGGVLLASLAIGKRYVGYDKDLAHHNESNKLIEWFPTVGITVDAKMVDHVPSGPCMCSYIPFGDEYIDELLNRTDCSKYVLIVPGTIKYQGSIVETYTTDDHWGEHQWHIVIINK